MTRHALIVALCCPLLGTSTFAARADGPLGRARSLLDRDDPRGAASVLEMALPTVSASEKSALLDLLATAYEAAAKRAESQGKTAEAAAFRADLLILNRRPKAPATPAPSGMAEPAPPKALPQAPLAPPAPPEPLPVPAPVELPPLESMPAPELAPPRDNGPEPAPIGPVEELKAADADFRAERYAEAGRRYASLAARGALPANRTEHWAYCRCVVLVHQINKRPSTAEWPAIREEVAAIQKLSPRLWVGEYIRDLVRERSGVTTPAPKVAAAPAPTQVLDPPKRRVQTIADRGPTTRQTAPADGFRNLPPTPTGPPSQMKLTANFRIFHEDPVLAEKVARIAEATRAEQTKRWTDAAAREEWTPRCDIYLYQDPKQFAHEHNQPEDSPGFSTMSVSGGKVSGRRLNLRADHATLLTAVLPHEVTHVVLADLFPNQPVPRWADEGMAVLSEPRAEQHARAAELTGPLESGRVFPLEQLMSMDYPDGRFWGLYYAQSVSLTQYLVSLGTPARFVEFLKLAEKEGAEAALRRTYRIDGFAALQRGWQEHARAASGSIAASSSDARVR